MVALILHHKNNICRTKSYFRFQSYEFKYDCEKLHNEWLRNFDSR